MTYDTRYFLYIYIYIVSYMACEFVYAHVYVHVHVYADIYVPAYTHTHTRTLLHGDIDNHRTVILPALISIPFVSPEARNPFLSPRGSEHPTQRC